MPIVTLDEMKAELGVTIDDDDDMIEAKIEAAQAHLEALLGYAIDDEYPDGAPADLVAAIKMLAAGQYENRESIIIGAPAIQTPHGVWDIVTNRRRYSFGLA